MIETSFIIPENKGLDILVLGAHADDIEIGCGGTLLKMIDAYDIGRVKWVVFTSNEVRKKEAETSAGVFLEPIKASEIKVFDYRDGFLPADWSSVKESFEYIKRDFNPDIIFTHFRDDLHQDHRVISELTWNTFRNHVILEYEIPKYDGDLGKPNFFVRLDKNQIERKIDIITKTFKSQLSKQWFDEVLLSSLARIRGVECASGTQYAEAFYSRKMTL